MLILNGNLLPLLHVPILHYCMLPYYSYVYEGTVIITVHEYNVLDCSSSNSPCRMVAVSTTEVPFVESEQDFVLRQP